MFALLFQFSLKHLINVHHVVKADIKLMMWRSYKNILKNIHDCEQLTPGIRPVSRLTQQGRDVFVLKMLLIFSFETVGPFLYTQKAGLGIL